jgi:hypothetical protein
LSRFVRRLLLGACDFSSVELNVFSKVVASYGTFHLRTRRSTIVDRANLFDWSERSVLRLVVHVLSTSAEQRAAQNQNWKHALQTVRTKIEDRSTNQFSFEYRT